MIGQLRLNELTPQICEKLATDLLARFSRPYARKILVSFKGILSEARTQGWLKSNPAENVRIVLSERCQPKHEAWLTIADVKKLLCQADKKAANPNKQLSKRWRRYRAFVYVMMFSGMRPGEVLGLPWRNISFKDRTIKVDQDMDDDGKIGRPKSRSAYRTIPVGGQVLRILRAWKKECPSSKHDLVFPNWKGNAEKIQNVYRRCWYTLQSETGLVDEDGEAKYPLKDLRHVRASLEIDSGANPKEITALMGHSSVKITYDVYGHLFADHSDRRAQRAGKIESQLLSS
jgi:integrase